MMKKLKVGAQQDPKDSPIHDKGTTITSRNISPTLSILVLSVVSCLCLYM